jgi:hypothetical protein
MRTDMVLMVPIRAGKTILSRSPAWKPRILYVPSFTLFSLFLATGMHAQSHTGKESGRLARIVSGRAYPLTLRLNQLTPRWRRISMRRNIDPTYYTPALAHLLGDDTERISLYYTRGNTVRIGGQTYLVAYHAQMTRPTYAASRRPPSPTTHAHVQKLTRNSLLRLSLLNLRLCGHFLDIRPFDLQGELAEANRPAPFSFGVFQTARLKAANSACDASLKQIGAALLMYCQDHEEKFPPMQDAPHAKKALLEYVRSESVFTHPRTHQAYRPNAALTGKGLAQIASPSRTVAFYEASVSGDHTRGVLFVDGGVRRLSENEWKKIAPSAAARAGRSM